VLQPDHSYLPYVANWAGTWIGKTGRKLRYFTTVTGGSGSLTNGVE
jgi:hypothetical protein